MQGLTFAEWELDRQCMKDAKGNAVAAPLNWVFSILATQGYYPRPSGYVSPVEQAERDREMAQTKDGPLPYCFAVHKGHDKEKCL